MIAPVVKLGLAERFLNWYAHHTKLYIRGQQGKDWNEQRRLDQELADAIGPWLRSLVDERTADLRAELAEARRERDEATGERAACMVLFGEYGIKWAEDLPHTVDVLCRRLCCVAIDNGRAERALASADVHVQWLRAERAEQSCLALERDAAEAMALVLNHEGHIAKLETERDRWKQQVYDYENKEAKCCPEDVGFSEWIAALTKKLDAALARLADPRLAAWREVPDDDREAIAFGMACDATDAEVCCCHETYPDKKCRHHAAVIRIAAAVLEWAQEGRE